MRTFFKKPSPLCRRARIQNCRIAIKGRLFLFRLRGSRGGFGTYAGAARFEQREILTIAAAWEKYGAANGATSLDEFVSLVTTASKEKSVDKNTPISCLILRDMNFFENQIISEYKVAHNRRPLMLGRPTDEKNGGVELFQKVQKQMQLLGKSKADQVMIEGHGKPEKVSKFIRSPEKVVGKFSQFMAFMRFRNRDKILDPAAENLLYDRKKCNNAIQAREVLEYEKWDESIIGSGEISHRCSKAIDIDSNLVYPKQKALFKSVLETGDEAYDPNAERVLFNIYKSTTSDQEADAFAQAVKTFDGYYDLISYLFFIKDPSRFLPVRPRLFQKCLASVGVGYKLAKNCSWDNYQGFIRIAQEIQAIIHDVVPNMAVHLIDVHFFLMMTNEQDFLNWEPDADVEANEERYLNTLASEVERATTQTTYYRRSAEISAITKLRANGECQLCGKPAPFLGKDQKPYLETHHVIWLSRGGADSLDNTVALCPNCHTKMHIVDDTDDIVLLKRKAERLSKSNAE